MCEATADNSELWHPERQYHPRTEEIKSLVYSFILRIGKSLNRN